MQSADDHESLQEGEGIEMIVQREIDKEELHQATKEICDGYCKYPHIWDEDVMECELSESQICRRCPLTQLIDGIVTQGHMETVEIQYLDGTGFRIKDEP